MPARVKARKISLLIFFPPSPFPSHALDSCPQRLARFRVAKLFLLRWLSPLLQPCLPVKINPDEREPSTSSASSYCRCVREIVCRWEEEACFRVSTFVSSSSASASRAPFCTLPFLFPFSRLSCLFHESQPSRTTILTVVYIPSIPIQTFIRQILWRMITSINIVR